LLFLLLLLCFVCQLPQSQKVSIQVFDADGRLIKTIANSQMEAGTHQLTWNAVDENGDAVAKGMYYLKFNAGSYAETKKLSVIK
jgi:flagellar basal-body rod modification protein FlgD